MNKTVRSVMVGLVAIGVAEIVFRGADAAFYAWYLLFVLWIVRLFTGFVLAAVDAYKAAFAKGLDLTMAFPEFEQKKASFSRGGGREESGASSKTTSGTGSQFGTEDKFSDYGVNPIMREGDPFGEFFDY
ncbi:hypothetical protein [Alloalcanivorax xenomutans]|uniref:hypothetical protein n=1 Tax=Alloalcanivorax xenomutans TaxID=1094342 RepID=UPI00292E289F|nr:hypothetical protein [Alloalcanivorax xenomutans]WOA31640.1 hypothetical protein RVY87_00905 [Alloalcanivorax xenomutans]